nr:unnamed protein product [Callosobruchus analis]
MNWRYQQNLPGKFGGKAAIRVCSFTRLVQQQYPEAYEDTRKNAGMLISTFDLHKTLLDLLNLTILIIGVHVYVVKKNSRVVKAVADFVVSYTNSLLYPYQLCATLGLHVVLDERSLTHARLVLGFEAAVGHGKESNAYSAIETISRLTIRLKVLVFKMFI